MNKCLIILTGNSFRDGSSGVFECSNTQNNFMRQKLASFSHIRLFKYIKNKFDIDSDVLINSYKTIFDEQLIDFYKEYSILVNLNQNQLSSELDLVNQTYDLLNDISIENKYKFVLFIRIDFYIKKYFLSTFKINKDKIIYAHVDSNPNTYDLHLKFYPLVCHNITYVPHKYYNFIQNRKVWYKHISGNNIAEIIGHENIDLFIKSLHWSSTDIEWNPIYSMVGRPEKLIYEQCEIIQQNYTENIIFNSKGLYFNTSTLEKYLVNDDNTYKDIMFTDTIEENLYLINNSIFLFE